MVSSILPVIYFSMAWLVWRHSARKMADWFFITVMLLAAGPSLSRAYTSIVLKNSGNFLINDTTQAVYLMGFTLFALMHTIGFFLLATRRLHTRLVEQAQRDSLTGALNRRALLELVEIELLRAKRHQSKMSLLTIDLDKFKQINDKYGHDVGDNVLIHFCTVVTNAKRGVDHFARLGGEEFVLLLPDTEGEKAREAAERIRKMLQSNPDPRLPVYTSSFGVTTQTDINESFDAMFGRADKALYLAKSSGRDRIEVA